MIQSGAPVQPLSVSFSGAHMTHIRLNRIIPVMKQFDGKWAGVYLAGVAVGVNIISDGA